MRTLLDTCVLSEIMKPQGALRVKNRVEGLQSSDLFISVITIGEIAKGVAQLEHGRKRDQYSQYLLRLEQDFESHIVPIDVETARIWGEMAAKHKLNGKALSVPDGLIASSAIRNGLHVMTRNVKDFEDTGALIVNPWQDA